MQTLGDYLTYWLREVVEPNLSPATWATYDYVSRCYLVPGLGKKRLDRLQARDVQIWLNEVGRTCQCCAQGKDARRSQSRQKCCAVGRCCRDLPSPTTIDHIRRVLRAALSQAILDGYATSNAAKSVRLPTIRTHKRKAWTSDEARRFLESARADGDRLYPAYVLVLVLGLRKGELLGLGWDDLDLDAGTVAIDWQIQRVGKVRGIERRRTKTPSSDATLPLPPICVTALKEQRTVQAAAREEAGDAWQENGLVITTRFGTRSSRVTSCGSGTAAASKPGYGTSPCTTPGVPVARCSPIWTYTPGWRCRSSGTPISRSRWRSTRRSPTSRRATRSSVSGRVWADDLLLYFAAVPGRFGALDRRTRGL
jgi:integrase